MAKNKKKKKKKYPKKITASELLNPSNFIDKGYLNLIKKVDVKNAFVDAEQ